MKRAIILLGLVYILSGNTGHASGNQQTTPSSGEVLATLIASADYAVNILIDEEGKSRCDYNLVENRWVPYEEPWHTGQLINALLEAYRITKDQRYLQTAIKAGNWWTELEIKDKPELKGMVKGIHGNFIGDDLIVFATISDGTPGLYHLSEVTGDKKYAQIATNAARWMLRHMYAPELGVCYDNVDIRNGRVIKQASDYDKELHYFYRPNTEGSLFKNAYEFSGEQDFREAFVTLSDSLIGFQGPEGIWMQFKPNNPVKNSFHPRYNLWNAESLLEAYELTKDRKYLDCAARTARFYTNYQQKDGAMFYHAKLDGTMDKSSICSSEVAFAGLLWMRLAQYGYSEFIPYYQRSAQWLQTAAFSLQHDDPNLRGAMIEITTSIHNGKPRLINRDLGTTFAIRFLAAYYELITQTDE